MRSRLWLLALVAAFAMAALPAAAQEAAPAGPVSFIRDVAPVLVQNCLACHGPLDAKGAYQVANYELLLRPGESGGASIVPGKPDESELYRLISETDKDLWMPKEGDRLADEAIARVRLWIEQGATFDGRDPKAALASIIPEPPHPNPPETYRVPVPVTALAFHPSGVELAVGGYHEITIWNPADGSLLRRITNVAQRTYGLAYSPDGSLLAAASGTPGQLGDVKLYNSADGSVVKDLGSMADVAFDVAFSPDGTRLAACSADRSIRIYDVAGGTEQVLIEDHADWVMAIAFNHDGTRLASASRDKTSKVFDTATGESLITYPGHADSVFGVDWSLDGTQILSSGRDRKIHVWNPADGAKIAEMAGFGHEVYKTLLVGNRVFACSADNTAREFAADSKAQTRAYAGHTDWVFTLSFHEPTMKLATGSFDGEVRIWNVADGAGLVTFKAAPGFVPPAAAQAAAQ